MQFSSLCTMQGRPIWGLQTRGIHLFSNLKKDCVDAPRPRYLPMDCTPMIGQVGLGEFGEVALYLVQ